MSIHIAGYSVLLSTVLIGGVLAMVAIDNAKQETYRQALISADLLSQVSTLKTEKSVLQLDNEDFRKKLGATPERARLSWEARCGFGGYLEIRFTNAYTGEVIRTERQFW
jgi:hypothetical protein